MLLEWLLYGLFSCTRMLEFLNNLNLFFLCGVRFSLSLVGSKLVVSFLDKFFIDKSSSFAKGVRICSATLIGVFLFGSI